MKTAARTFLLLFIFGGLTGCGMDLAQFYILFKEQGRNAFNPYAWQQDAHSSSAAMGDMERLAKRQSGVAVVKNQDISKYTGKIVQISENNRQYIQKINTKYGPQAAKEVQAVIAELEKEVIMAASASINEADFDSRVAQIFQKNNVKMQTILSKYRQENI